jgi:DnaJ-class molecular chaperone
MNYYYILGISADATAEEVRKAYLALAKKYHPDKNKSPEATGRMAEINLAYETLCDSAKRGKYDLQNGIVAEEEEVVMYEVDEEEIGQEEPPVGRCAKCNFVNSSGLFVCSVCGNVFEPEGKKRKVDRHENDEEITSDDIEEVQENMSEIIRCPQCNEINVFSRGSCWQCGLAFEIEELA